MMLRMRKMSNRIKAFFERLDVTNHGYVVNKWLTNGAFVLLLAYMFLLVVVDGPSILAGGFYAECPGPVDCANPFYDDSCLVTGVVCESEFVSPGWSYGVRPSFATRSFPLVALLVLFIVLLVNHRKYNKGYNMVWRIK